MTFLSVKTMGLAMCASLYVTILVNSFGSEKSYLSSMQLNGQINKHPNITFANKPRKIVFFKAEGEELSS